jgi:DNA-binding winged helix-turn-helix (wHTH) protein
MDEKECMMIMRESTVYAFGPFRLDPQRRQLMEHGQPVLLTPKVLKTLCVLVAHAGQVIGKEELMKEIWPDVTVDEGNLKVKISLLRKILGEGYIETVPGRGYRFRDDIRFLEDVTEPDDDFDGRTTARFTSTEPDRRWRRRLRGGGRLPASDR